jgi:hypothetical protein
MLSRTDIGPELGHTPALAPPLTPPRRYLVRMVVFLVLAGFLVFILHEEIWRAFMANPGLNGLIIGILFIGVILAIRQVIRLFREVRWVNQMRRLSEDEVPVEQPVLLAPMAALLGNRASRSGLPVATTRSLLDSIAARLDENREIIRYLAGLLVFLGLLGTFWGLIDTVSSVGRVIQSMRAGAETGALFDELKSGLAAPLAGMGPVLLGLAVRARRIARAWLPRLQAGQAQGRFYNELEDWLAGATTDASGTEMAIRRARRPIWRSP